MRDPFDRAVSAYLDKFCGQDRNAAWVRSVVAAAGSGGGISFLQFLRHLETQRDEQMNGHWRPQAHIVRDVDLDAVVRLERLEAEFGALAGRVGTRGLPFLKQVRQATSGSRFPAGAIPDAATRSSLDLVELARREGRLPHRRDLLSDASVEAITRVYAADFARFGYASVPRQG